MKKLTKYEHVVAVVPESCEGPGWSNRVIWVFVRDGDGKLRMEALQPEEQTETMYLMFDTLESAHGVMLAEVRRALKPKKRRAS